MKQKGMKFTLNQVRAFDAAIRGLNNLRRWTEFVKKEQYNELNKQALNCIIAFIIAKIMESNYKKKIIWHRFPKLAISRMFQKMGLADVVYSTYESIVVEQLNSDMDAFNKAVEVESIRVIMQRTMSEMTQELQNDSDDIIDFLDDTDSSYEFKIYKAASIIATLIEIQELKSRIENDIWVEKYVEINESIKDFSIEIPAIKDILEQSMFALLRKISTLRNQNRWAIRSYQVDCSVLGHLFDTAVFAYLMSIDRGDDEEEAAHMFFCGIWHDIPETWTKDIPSPTKDAFKGFRKASEDYEMQCVQKNIYDVVPDCLKEAIKGVMMEDENLKDIKPFLKAADYLSADSECFRQLVAGSRDKYFRDRVIIGDLKIIEEKGNITGAFAELVKYYYNEVKDLKLLG